MRHLVPAFLAVAVLAAASAPPATAASALGVSFGAGQMDPANPLRFDSYQATSAFRYRMDLGTPFTEIGFGLVNRAQALAPTKQYVYETSGVGLSGGLHFGFLRAGLGLEAAWLRKIVMDTAATPAGLAFQNTGGIVVEPYLGVQLPLLKSEVTELELSVHYPVIRPDPAMGPRLLLTLWLGGEALEDDEDEEEPEEPETDEEETDEDEPAVTPAPTPAPSAKPTPKPAKPAAPAKPKPKPRR